MIMCTRKMAKPAVGCVRGGYVKLVCAIDPETFAQIRARAVEKKTSVAEIVRTLIEWGLEAVDEQNPV